MAKMVTGLVAAAALALVSTAAVAAASKGPTKVPEVAAAEYYFSVKPPAGYTMCSNPDGIFFTRPSFTMPLDKAATCDKLPQPMVEYIDFHVDHLMEPENDPWVVMKRDCRKNRDIVSAEFLEMGKIAGGFPARGCVRTYESGKFKKSVIIQRGVNDDESSKVPLFYMFTAYSNYENRKALDAMLTATLAEMKIKPE